MWQRDAVIAPLYVWEREKETKTEWGDGGWWWGWREGEKMWKVEHTKRVWLWKKDWGKIFLNKVAESEMKEWNKERWEDLVILSLKNSVLPPRISYVLPPLLLLFLLSSSPSSFSLSPLHSPHFLHTNISLMRVSLRPLPPTTVACWLFCPPLI